MTSETTTAPTQAVEWADTEKIALLFSVIKATGSKVEWDKVSVPASHTVQSAAKMYSEMMKASAAVAMTHGTDITPSKKRARKNAPAAANDDVGGAATPTKKKTRVRKSKVKAVSSVEDDEEGEEEGPSEKKVKVEAKDEEGEEEGPSEKKVKVEAKDEEVWGEDGMDGELDSQEWGAAA